MTPEQVRADEHGAAMRRYVAAAVTCCGEAVNEADPDRVVGLLDAAMDELAAGMELARQRAKMLRQSKGRP